MLSPKRDMVAAKHFLQLALWRSAVRPRVINVDGHPAYAHAIAELKEAGELGARCRCRTAPYLNNIVEHDHRFIKKRIAASLGFRSVTGAVNTISGYEAMHMICTESVEHHRSRCESRRLGNSISELMRAGLSK